jgi:hypothetical protein
MTPVFSPLTSADLCGISELLMELDALMAMHHMYGEALDKLLPFVWNRFYICILGTENHISTKKY